MAKKPNSTASDTPLMVAIRAGDLDLLKKLFARGANPNAPGTIAPEPQTETDVVAETPAEPAPSAESTAPIRETAPMPKMKKKKLEKDSAPK